jgi:hypothetical protein
VKAVIVEWFDAFRSTSTGDFSELKDKTNLKPLRRHSIGFVVHEDDLVLVLSETYSEEKTADTPFDGSGFMLLPKCMVQKTTDVSVI